MRPNPPKTFSPSRPPPCELAPGAKSIGGFFGLDMRTTKQPAGRAHYMMKFVRHQALEQKIPMEKLAQDSGVSYMAIRRTLRGDGDISLCKAEALLNTLGYRMGPVRV